MVLYIIHIYICNSIVTVENVSAVSEEIGLFRKMPCSPSVIHSRCYMSHKHLLRPPSLVPVVTSFVGACSPTGLVLSTSKDTDACRLSLFTSDYQREKSK